MIVVNCGIMQKDIIRLVEDHLVNGEKVFNLEKVKNNSMYFNTKLDSSLACSTVNKIMKGYKYQSILFYSVLPVRNGEIQWF